MILARRIDHLIRVATVAVVAACGSGVARMEEASPLPRDAEARGIVGRWELLVLMRDGADRSNRGVGARHYTFEENGSFRITRGDSVLETGTWSQDTTASPKVFDHIPNVSGRPGRYVPGIFKIAGDTLTIAILPPSPERRRPTRFRSALEDRSWLLVLRRDRR